MNCRHREPHLLKDYSAQALLWVNITFLIFTVNRRVCISPSTVHEGAGDLLGLPSVDTGFLPAALSPSIQEVFNLLLSEAVRSSASAVSSMVEPAGGAPGMRGTRRALGYLYDIAALLTHKMTNPLPNGMKDLLEGENIKDTLQDFLDLLAQERPESRPEEEVYSPLERAPVHPGEDISVSSVMFTESNEPEKPAAAGNVWPVSAEAIKRPAGGEAVADWPTTRAAEGRTELTSAGEALPLVEAANVTMPTSAPAGTKEKTDLPAAAQQGRETKRGTREIAIERAAARGTAAKRRGVASAPEKREARVTAEGIAVSATAKDNTAAAAQDNAAATTPTKMPTGKHSAALFAGEPAARHLQYVQPNASIPRVDVALARVPLIFPIAAAATTHAVDALMGTSHVLTDAVVDTQKELKTRRQRIASNLLKRQA